MVEIGNSREILIVEQRKKIYNLVVDPFGEIINDSGDKLIDICVCEQNSLKILDAYFKHKRTHRSVHMAPRFTGSKIYNR